MKSLKAAMHTAGSWIGVDLIRYGSVRHPVGRRMRLIHHLGIDLVLDVGANLGQFGLELRRNGYLGRIVSFEPLAEPFARLSKIASAHPQWDVFQLALGEMNRAETIHVAANSGASSSFFPSTYLNDAAAPQARFVGTEAVEVRRLDDVAADLVAGARATYLKVDVQGAERRVLEGAPTVLARSTAVQLELSLRALYIGSPLYDELLDLMTQRGFALAGLEPGFTDPSTGWLLQTDALFVVTGAHDRSIAIGAEDG
jgi:FkbM family methyltransferase